MRFGSLQNRPIDIRSRCGAFLFWNLGKIFSFGIPYSSPLHRLGWKLAWRSRPLVNSTQNFTPIGVMCRHCGANLEIARPMSNRNTSATTQYAAGNEVGILLYGRSSLRRRNYISSLHPRYYLQYSLFLCWKETLISQPNKGLLKPGR